MEKATRCEPEAPREDYPGRFVSGQIRAWKKANRKMGWGITRDEFHRMKRLSVPPGRVSHPGFRDLALFYGFGNDGRGNADPVLSGKIAWDYACRNRWRKTWQCEYIDFDKPDHIRLRSGAPARPKGFYFGRVNPSNRSRGMTVSKARKAFQRETGLGPEGIQMMAITHPYLQDMMDMRKAPFMVLADYDVAPYGFNDFFDALQIFCSLEVLGLGIGNVDRNYPLFGIPSISLLPEHGTGFPLAEKDTSGAPTAAEGETSYPVASAAIRRPRAQIPA